MFSSSEKLRAFVVDDDQPTAAMLALVLWSKGLFADLFDDPQEVLRAAESKSPDLLVTDVRMPALSGISLAVKIRKTFPNCKVLFISGQKISPILLADAGAENCDFEVLDKPVHPKEFVNKIQSLLQSAGTPEAINMGECLHQLT